LLFVFLSLLHLSSALLSFPTRRSSDLRPLHVNTSDRVRHLLIFATRLRDCRKTVKRFLFRRSDHGWKVGRHALRPKGACQLNDRDRKSTRLNSSHVSISYAVFCLKKKN